jgi:chromodomain-helicase-DNA-binding protein 4
MCFVLEDSGVAALNSFAGDKAASSSLANSLHRLEAVCEDIVQMLRVEENGTATKEEGVDASSKEIATPLQDSIPVVANGEPSTVKSEDKMAIKPDGMEIKPSNANSDDKMEIDG